LRYYYKALIIYEKENSSKDSINCAKTLQNIGNVDRELAKYDEAHQYYIRALKIYEKNSKISINCASTFDDIGCAYKE